MSKYQDITKLLDGFVEGGLPGCALSFARDGEVLYEHYAGCDNLETGHKLDEKTLFRMMSMTKVVEYDANGNYTLRPAKSPILVKDAFRMSCGIRLILITKSIIIFE